MEKDTTIGSRRLADLFDAGTFAEVGAYIKRGDGKPSGVRVWRDERDNTHR